MDFGRLSNVSRVDFSLPADTPETERVLRLARERSLGEGGPSPETWVGLPIWTSKEWVGSIYPEGAKPHDFLKHYAQQFGAIELNSTFYAIPDLKTVDQWRESTPATFRFCPKVHQEVSQGLGNRFGGDTARRFFEAVLRFEGRLGLCFLQLPPSLGPLQGLFALERFFRSMPERLPMAVEFRHPQWFVDRALIAPAVKLLERYQIATVITDTAGRRDVSHASLTVPRVLVRFLGNEGHPSDRTRAEDWAARVKRWQELGLEQLYFFAHEHDNVLAPQLIRALVQSFNERSGLRLRDWEPQRKQMSLF